MPDTLTFPQADCALDVVCSPEQSGRAAAEARPLFIIPECDDPAFARLDPPVRQKVKWMLAAFELIDAAENKQSACRAQASAFSGVRGFSVASLCRKYYDYMRSGGDWRIALDKAKAGPAYWATEEDRGLPAEFVDFWKGLCERNQRKSEPARRELLRIWRTKFDTLKNEYKEIPGYAEWPQADPFTGVPVGWSKENLSRKAPSKFERTAARIGRSAAAAHRPLVSLTRSKLAVGQFFLFDDFWHDFKVNVLGQRHAQRLLQFHCLDLFSGCNCARGYKPALEDDMTGAEKRLREVDMHFLVAYVLGDIGYRLEGTRLVVEHRTAAINSILEGLISDLTNQAVLVDRSSMEGASAFAGMYAGRSKGNFKFKAALESSGNLLHNETAMLPGQVGMNRDNCPEELHGREKLNDALRLAALALPPERASLLRMPFLELNQALWIVEEIHNRINARTEHDLEGWEQAGLVTTEFRLALEGGWQPMQKLFGMPDAQRNAIEAFLTMSQGMTRARKLSPSEVFEAGRKQLRKLPPHKTAMLLWNEKAPERTARRTLFEFEDADLGPGEHRYLAELHPVDGPARLLRDGEKFRTVVNPLKPDHLFLFSAKGGFLGVCPRWAAVSRDDTDALARACGKAAKIEGELLAPLARRGADLTRKRIADAKHNAAVAGGKPVTEAEKEEARELAREVKEHGAEAAAEIFTPRAETPSVESTQPAPDSAEEFLALITKSKKP